MFEACDATIDHAYLARSVRASMWLSRSVDNPLCIASSSATSFAASAETHARCPVRERGSSEYEDNAATGLTMGQKCRKGVSEVGKGVRLSSIKKSITNHDTTTRTMRDTHPAETSLGIGQSKPVK